MDNIRRLLTTTEGRIGRQQWWIGILAMLVISLIATALISTFSFGNATVFGWLALLLNLALLYPAYCLGIKRRHDRNSDGKDVLILLGASVVLNLLMATGIGVQWVDPGQGIVIPVPAVWLSILNFAFGIFAIYMLVQLGVLKGTTGSNDYGPDPLDGAA